MSNKDAKKNDGKNVQPIEEHEAKGKNFLTILLMAILIGTGVYAFFRGAPEETETDITEQIQEMTDEAEEEMTEESDDEVTEVPTEPEVVEETEEAVTIRVSPGDGVTHLSRKAIQERLARVEKELSVAQKIYAETVLTRNASYFQESLDIDAEITFSLEDIDSIIEGAENLSEQQIQAWDQYSPHVPSLQ